MPLDAITLNALLGELKPELLGAKIDKVQQPERDTVLLSLRGGGKNRRLLICAGTGNARIHFTEATMENPSSPPMFCMLLRKHLTGARINEVSQPYMDRLTVFNIGAFDELGNPESKRLVVEMMGRNSNIILEGEDGRIIDCLRRVGSPADEGRALQPGLIYREPTRRGAARLVDCKTSEIEYYVNHTYGDRPAGKWLTDTFQELSPLVSGELLHRAEIDPECEMDEITNTGRARLVSALSAVRDTVIAGRYLPYMVLVNGKPRDFSFFEVEAYGGGAHCERYPGFSVMLDEFYTRRDMEAGLRRRSSQLVKTVKNLRDRRIRTLENQRNDLAESGERETLRRAGELITANMYRLKKGDSILEAEDYYDESGEAPVVRIELDMLKTPQQNAAAYYKKYSKLKAAREHLTLRIESGERELAYLNSVLDELERTESASGIEEIQQELIHAGFLKAPAAKKKRRDAPGTPISMKSATGFEIRIGRNNRQNDVLTFKEASKRDIWLHVQKIHGSHVIIKCDGKEPDEATIYEAARLAAVHSAARGGGKVPVDYTAVKNVKKLPGALPGMVTYSDYKTINVGSEKV